MGSILRAALPIVGAAVGGPVGAAIGGAAGGAIGGGGIRGALVGAATGYAGNAIGNSIGSSLTSSLANAGASNATTNALANTTIGRLASNVVGPATGSSLIGGALGSYAGNSIAGSIADTLMPAETDAPEVKGETPFIPSRQGQLSLPGSLSNLQGLDDTQQSSNIANQGVYGGGAGPDEQAYFTNLINRRLVDDSGNVDQDLSEINPIESSYLDQLGFGSNRDPRSLLEALNKWNSSRAA